MNKVPQIITHASIVSRETVKIALMIVTLNDLQVKLADTLNTCIKAPATENALTILGP